MAGTSRRQLSDFYEGELSGVIASNWGEDVMVTCDDKLHMSEQTTVQEVKGPVNFSKSGSTYTFASPVNFSSTIITPGSNNLASLTTDEVSQLENIGGASITAGEWGYLAAMDQSVASGGTVAFAGLGLVNTVNEFSKDTTLGGNSDTAVPTEKAVKTYADLRALWISDNSAVARYWAICGRVLVNLISDAATHGWTYDSSNWWNECVTISDHFYPVHLPHGAIVTALRIRSQRTGGAYLEMSLRRKYHDGDGAGQTMANVNATTTMEEVSDTSIDNNPIDNNTFGYYVRIDLTTSAEECRLKSIQIDYTVTRPQP